MYRLYYYPGNASLLPHTMLHEIGAAHELILVDRSKDAQRSPDYLRLNPNGRIPVLVDGETVLFETAAIALYLVEQHPQAGLGPLPGENQRPEFLKWMIHLCNTPQVDFLSWFYPDRYAETPEASASVKRAAEQRLNHEFDLIAAQLGGKPYLLGERFSAADLFLFMLIRWGRAMPRPPRSLAPLAALAARVAARPAVQRTIAAEKLGEPSF